MLQLASQLFTGLVALLSAMGLLFIVFDIFQFRSEILRWWKQRKELTASVVALATADHFVAHVIQLGGQFSTVRSLNVRVDSEGGWYLNPPERFVVVWWTRGGDLMHVSATDFAEKRGGFVPVSYKDCTGKVTKLTGGTCAVPIPNMRNEYEIRFARTRRSS
jgi:hypothetical protein